MEELSAVIEKLEAEKIEQGTLIEFRFRDQGHYHKEGCPPYYSFDKSGKISPGRKFSGYFVEKDRKKIILVPAWDTEKQESGDSFIGCTLVFYNAIKAYRIVE